MDKISQWWALVPCDSGVETSGSATRQFIGKKDLTEIDCEDWRWMDLGQGSCPMKSFGISGVEILCSATGELVNW